MDRRLLMHLLSQFVTVHCIDRLAGSMLMFHGCAIADSASGKTLAAVADSGMGKTTLVKTLGAGRVYLSDETVAPYAGW